VDKRVLITGGAGFIGSHLADELLGHGYSVRALDNLVDQVHEENGRPGYLDDDIELVVADVRDRELLEEAVEHVDAVVHLAARVGVGQSMYEIADYCSANTSATGVLLETLLDHPVEKLVVASSMSVYGEGLYADAAGRPVVVRERTRDQLRRGEWDPVGSDGDPLEPVPTPETKPPALSSVYALTKYDQERLALIYGAAYGVPTVALRFFNVYGPRQALSNPYTGVLAIFASRLLNERPPLVYEDGLQRRDFVSVRDVARACRLALEREGADGRVVNVGSGRSVSVVEIADKLAAELGTSIQPELTGKARTGDIRHCFADVSLAQELLGFQAQVELEDGMRELAAWLAGQVVVDRVDAAANELAERGLTV
jgi:dTDP-L-rhamnose 4-epimerase